MRPAELGYRWPAEWEPHAATWLAWPHNPETWPGRLDRATQEYARLVAELCRHEAVRILVADAEVEAGARRALAGAGVPADATIEFLHIPTNDSWLRDSGPLVVVREQAAPAAPRRALVDFGFDSWGRKYPPWDLDAAVPSRIAERLGFERFEAGFVLEGGSIDGNGRGTVLTTESCLLHPNRGEGRTRESVEQVLADFLATSHVLWLSEGIVGDDTDGHIDDVARFVGPDTVLAAVEADTADPNHGPLSENLRRLRSMRDQDGKPLLVAPLPMPPPHLVEALRCPASYANFYFAGNAVLVPTFGAPSDARALDVVREVLPKHEVVGVPCGELVYGLGAIHCLSQQEPL